MDAAAAEKKLEEVFGIPFVMVEQYDLRTEVTGGTRSFKKEEVEQAKKLIINKLIEEDIEKYKPRLLLLDTKNEYGIIVIFSISPDESSGDDRPPLGRTFHVQNGVIIYEAVHGHDKSTTRVIPPQHE